MSKEYKYSPKTWEADEYRKAGYHTCECCGKPFIRINQRQKYCCKTCRLKSAKATAKKNGSGRGYKKDQLCWDCKKACGGCNWSDKLKPVKGWTAEERIIKSNGEPSIHTYKIIKCPEFDRDDLR